jgi:hypothetical protein
VGGFSPKIRIIYEPLRFYGKTCFKALDLPLFQTKAQLEEALLLALTALDGSKMEEDM